MSGTAPGTDTMIDALSARLASPGEVLLSDPERALLAAALGALAADQALIARLARLIEVHERGGALVDDALRAGVDAARLLGAAPAPGAGFDLARSRAAREELARAAREARSGREIIGAALAFAREAMAWR